MGAEMWEHLVPFQDDVQKALDELKEEEFKAGRFRRSVSDQEPTTPEEALRLAGDMSTGSVLDMMCVSEKPDIQVISPLSKEHLFRFYSTDKPIRRHVLTNIDVAELIGKGQGIYVIVYENNMPSELYFAGYTF